MKPSRSTRIGIIHLAQVENLIHVIRGQKVMLDGDLAVLYDVAVKALNQAVKRNRERFPEDFCFQLTKEESDELERLRSQVVTLKRGEHRKYQPFAFTEQGVARLSSVLRSPRAVQVNLEIMRAFVRLRRMLASNAELARRLNELEKEYDAQLKVVFEAIRQLTAETEATPAARREIGFHTLRERARHVLSPRTGRRLRPVRY